MRGLKGPQRPFVPFEGRAEVLAALRSVDAVVGFDESTPVDLLAALKPDIHVKSAQYRVEELPERDVVESNGGRIVLARVDYQLRCQPPAHFGEGCGYRQPATL